MYYLVKFEDEIYYICNKSRIVIKDKSVSVKYTGGVWYPATIIECHGKYQEIFCKIYTVCPSYLMIKAYN